MSGDFSILVCLIRVFFCNIKYSKARIPLMKTKTPKFSKKKKLFTITMACYTPPRGRFGPNFHILHIDAVTFLIVTLELFEKSIMSTFWEDPLISFELVNFFYLNTTVKVWPNIANRKLKCRVFW